MNRYRFIRKKEGFATRRCPRIDDGWIGVGSTYCLKCHYCKGISRLFGWKFVKCSFKESKI